ncbi:hypothetical protein ACCO45_011964 [Purpureocillium lilacinum]|uniref:Uncharacterized protein n=1 Tax=Purpureocillium lilacinum TaxID=33203 RepID=A0ACC4DFC4_PURLI
MSSLDYRLRDSSHIRTHVIRLLQDLDELLEDALAIVGGYEFPWDQISDVKATTDQHEGTAEIADKGISVMDPNWSPSSNEEDSTESELDQISVDVVDVVNCLLRLNTSHYELFDIRHVQSKFNDIDAILAERLGKAISRRRQYFKYREAHHMKLSRGLDLHRAADATTTAGSADPQTVASSIPQQLKGGSDPMDGLLVFSEDRSDSGHTQTSYASSAAGKEEYRIPPLPTAASIGPFECPFCYRIITATSTASWKRHVHEDLRPYICLEKDCLAPEKEFPRRHQWMNHMKQSHWSTYTCPASCGATFPSVSACQEHIAQRHLGAYQASEIGVLIRLGAKPLGLTEGISCPLCRDLLRSAQQYQHHVGRHQEQLALFALPIVEMDDEVVAQAEVVDGSEESTVSSKAALNIEALEVEYVVRSLEKDVSTNNQAAADKNPEEAQHSPAPSPTFQHGSNTPSTNEIQQKALDPSPSEYIRRPIQDHAGDESDEVLITPDRAIAQILGEFSYVTKQLADQKHQPAPDTATSPKIEDIVSVLNKIRVPEEASLSTCHRRHAQEFKPMVMVVLSLRSGAP